MTSRNINSNEIVSAKPFLRWAGGKRWFLKYLEHMVCGINFKNYHEPFVGSAAVYFHLKPSNKSFLSDLNEELIDTYSAIKDDVEKVLSHLKNFVNTEKDYYVIRESRYRSDYKKAAKFIYLNQTSFNGIYRVNLNGIYNVPFGYRSKNFFEPENLRSVNEQLQNCEIMVSDFEIIKSKVRKSDLVFLDPPYTVTHNHNGFIKYNQKIFSIEDQYRLSGAINYIKRKGAYYILTNAAHKEIKKIFSKDGDVMFEVSRSSLIGGKNAKRGKFEELIITNIPYEFHQPI